MIPPTSAATITRLRYISTTNANSPDGNNIVSCEDCHQQQYLRVKFPRKRVQVSLEREEAAREHHRDISKPACRYYAREGGRTEGEEVDLLVHLASHSAPATSSLSLSFPLSSPLPLPLHIPLTPSSSSSSSSSSSPPPLFPIISSSTPFSTPNHSTSSTPTPMDIEQTAFLTLFTILESNLFPTLVSWTKLGDRFIIPDATEFAKIVLPRLFKYPGFPSFVRRLNKCGFQKWKVAHEYPRIGYTWTFKHPFFRSGYLEDISKIGATSASTARTTATKKKSLKRPNRNMRTTMEDGELSPASTSTASSWDIEDYHTLCTGGSRRRRRLSVEEEEEVVLVQSCGGDRTNGDLDVLVEAVSLVESRSSSTPNSGPETLQDVPSIEMTPPREESVEEGGHRMDMDAERTPIPDSEMKDATVTITEEKEKEKDAMSSVPVRNAKRQYILGRSKSVGHTPSCSHFHPLLPPPSRLISMASVHIPISKQVRNRRGSLNLTYSSGANATQTWTAAVARV